MQDRELAAAIVAGDPDGLAEAYDRYAAPLYAYCRFMLLNRGPSDVEPAAHLDGGRSRQHVAAAFGQRGHPHQHVDDRLAREGVFVLTKTFVSKSP